MYLYETHLHTSPISACAKASIRQSLEYYKSVGYAGVFMTEHFIDGNFDRPARTLPYDEKIKHYFSSYEEGKVIGEEIGLAVFPGIEIAKGATHFLVYGIDKEWCLAHPDMDKIEKAELLTLMRNDGALLIQAHPFREVADELRLYPNHVHGVEIFNAERSEFENRLAAQYCRDYKLIPFAGSDNHVAGEQEVFGGIATDRPILDVSDLFDMTLKGEVHPFVRDKDGVRLL